VHPDGTATSARCGLEWRRSWRRPPPESRSRPMLR
jgi:hypothetical protein